MIRGKRIHFVIAVSVLGMILNCNQGLHAEVKRHSINKIVDPPSIDGRLNDPCWQGIVPLSGFVQHDPHNGAAASEETLVWMAYDHKNIYFAFHLKDSEPGKIWAELTPRNGYEKNDTITVYLDTYNDQRTRVSFTVNPKGVQKNSHETIWKSAAAIQKDGWVAEIAIPFKSLRFSTAAIQTWAVNFERYIHRTNEIDHWSIVKRDIPFLLQMGKIEGLSSIKPSANLELFPYFGYRSSRQTNGYSEKNDKLAYGLDLKYGIASNLTLDITASPDFSQVESDPFIYQLSPYELFFQENRPFFNEGSQYFSVAVEHNYYGPSTQMFYSRRISSPHLATKVTGKAGAYSFGFLGAIQDEADGPDSFYTVARVQKDVFTNSQIGIYYAGMEREGDYNRNLSVDYNFNFKDVYSIRGQHLFSFNQNQNEGDNGMHTIQAFYQPDTSWQWSAGFRRIEPQVNIRTGYTGQTDHQRLSGDIGYAWRYNQGFLKRWSLMLMAGLDYDSSGNSVGRDVMIGSWLTFQEQFSAEVMLGVSRSKNQVVGVDGQLDWHPELFDKWDLVLELDWERGGFFKEIELAAVIAKKCLYDDSFSRVSPGMETRIESQVTLRPLGNLEWSAELGWTRQVLEIGKNTVFDGATYSSTIHYQLDRNLFLLARLLGETQNNQYNADLVAGYHFGAGNVVQLAYKKSSRNEIGQKTQAHSITLKLSYLLRL